MPLPRAVRSLANAAALTPLKEPTFRMLWLAWLAANMTMWMNDVAAAWLMTTLTTSPVMVALVQTASTLPVFLLGLPSGAMADILDRRRYFAATQLWVSINAMVLAALALTAGPRRGEELAVDRPVLTLGRAAACDLVIDDDSVSARHARLEWESGAWRITDLGSVNGTAVEGVTLPPETPPPLPLGSAQRLGWQVVGQVPGYALWPDGGLCATTIFYKAI